MRICFPAGAVFFLLISLCTAGENNDLLIENKLVTSANLNPAVIISLIPQHQQAHPSGELALAVILDVPKGWHLYANPKQGEYGLDTEIKPHPIEGLHFGQVQYPPGEFYEDKDLQASNYIYKGRIICYLPVQTTEKIGEFTIKITLKGQLCSDAGTCRLWEDQAQMVLPVQTGVSGHPNHPELFAAYQTPSWQSPNPGPVKTEPLTPQVNQQSISSGQWIKPILLALAAGLIMNLMPCVLPIIPIIVLTLIRQCAPQQEQPPDRGRSLRVGLVFAGGILIVFVGLAVVMSVFKLLWGQQFQGSGFKFALLMIVYVLSLSMFGLYEIVLPARLTNVSVIRQGYLGTFAMGLLATILATPCGAPLLTPVLAWSLAKPLAITVIVFLLIGTGMALPYVLLTAFPSLLNRVPRAGNWMLRLKQLIGFLMLAFTAYLITLFPPHWHGPLLYYCVVIGICIWLTFTVVNHTTPSVRRRTVRLLTLLIFIVASFLLGRMSSAPAPAAAPGAYWLTQRDDLLRQGQNVIVKFTANWCKNCAALDKLIYKQKTFQDKLTETNTALVIADWSYDDPKIKQMIFDLGGPGQALPFAAVFPARDPNHPLLLRDFYSLTDALHALDHAAEIK